MPVTPPRFARRSFTDRYVFPDGELHEVGAVVATMQAAGFEVRHVESLRDHYALTLRAWVANLEANWEETVAEAGAARARRGPGGCTWRPAPSISRRGGPRCTRSSRSERTGAEAACRSAYVLTGQTGSRGWERAAPSDRERDFLKVHGGQSDQTSLVRLRELRRLRLKRSNASACMEG